NQPLPAKSTVAQRKQANELRKTLKPLLEKRRRARINDSLTHLKSLIVPLAGKGNARYSKLEKADILEMTVRFLRDLPSTPVKDPADSYREGYRACLQRVSALLPQTSLGQDACQRIQQRLQILKSSLGSRLENQPRSSGAVAPGGAQPGPQAAHAAMWRPW
uniref:Hes family bHLH transcription factor 2 n=1 Tax=Tetraodon nigroviridis TaxID=99883 RepID=H3D358_TETNG